MRVDIKISAEISEPYAVIYSSAMTEEVARLAGLLEGHSSVIAGFENGKIAVLEPDEIYMARVEDAEITLYCQNKSYRSKKRLYELGEQLGSGFMQISKAAFVNLKQIDCVEPMFNGMMNLRLKNGCSEYISRTYLPRFKKYLGL